MFVGIGKYSMVFKMCTREFKLTSAFFVIGIVLAEVILYSRAYLDAEQTVIPVISDVFMLE